MPAPINLAGLQFDKWTVLFLVSDRGPKGELMWKCLCTCGTYSSVRGSALRQHKTSSCGCVRNEKKRTHGRTRDKMHRRWVSMVSRCSDPNSRSYKWYGARGITVCARWRGPNGFLNFVADMGECPEGLTIERINNDGNYEPGNCKWATWKEQSLNKRRPTKTTKRRQQQ